MVMCSAFNCNTRPGQGFAMFHYPKDPGLRKLWVEKLKRKDFTPSSHAKLCEKHFVETEFVVSRKFAESIGFEQKKLILKDDSVPSIFAIPEQQKRRHRSTSAVDKRRRIEIMHSALERSSPVIEEVDSFHHFEEIEPPINHHTVEPEPAPTHNELAVQAVIENYNSCTQTPRFLVPMRHVALQTDIFKSPTQRSRTIATQTEITQITTDENLDETVSNVGSLDQSFDSSADPIWHPPGDCEDDDFDEDNDLTLSQERKFIVFESQLDILLPRQCDSCGRSLPVLEKKIQGSGLYVHGYCVCGYRFAWDSQPSSGTMPLGNLLLAGAILFSGSSPCQTLRMMQHMSIQTISSRTFFLIQQLYLVPTIQQVYFTKQEQMIKDILDRGVTVNLGGDGRCCSPGHTAKYCSYTVMDLTTDMILDVKLVQSNEVGNSYRMEMEGLLRCLKELEDLGVEISKLVTDRHSQIKKYLKEQRPDITHQFDVWHVAKGVYKKLVAAGKKKGCENVAEWARSISNHLYWCAASSNGDQDLLREKWKSVLNHISNVHEGHGDLYTRCEHGPLDDDRLWLKKGYKPYDEVEKVVSQRLLVQDIGKLSPAEQTSGLEAFHKVLCHFAPKLVHFQHAQMEARIFLAAMHFNENFNRCQAHNRQGEPTFAVSYPKGREGDGVAKEIKVEQTYDYVDDLMEELILKREINQSYAKAKSNNVMIKRPPPLSANAEKTPKADIVKRHIQRFNC